MPECPVQLPACILFVDEELTTSPRKQLEKKSLVSSDSWKAKLEVVRGTAWLPLRGLCRWPEFARQDCPFITSLKSDRAGPSPWLSLQIITELEKLCLASLTDDG